MNRVLKDFSILVREYSMEKLVVKWSEIELFRSKYLPLNPVGKMFTQTDDLCGQRSQRKVPSKRV